MGTTAEDVRADIALEVGFKPTSMLKKNHLNSIYAYLNGRFLISPDRLFHPEEPTLSEVRVIVGAECGFNYDPDRSANPAGPPFNKEQLIAIYETCRTSDDHRPFASSSS